MNKRSKAKPIGRNSVLKQVGWGSVNLVQISFKDLPFFIKSSLCWLKCVLFSEHGARAHTDLKAASIFKNNSGQINWECKRDRSREKKLLKNYTVRALYNEHHKLRRATLNAKILVVCLQKKKYHKKEKQIIIHT